MIYFHAWLISLDIIIFIHVAVGYRIAFFFEAESHVIVYIYHIFFILSVDGHLGCFRILAIVKRTSVDMCALMFL